MTPQQFAGTYRPTADQVTAGTGIDPIALLSQWANETAWGTSWAGAPYNLANIRNGPGGSIISYPSLVDFVSACIWTFHNARPNLSQPVSATNNYYWSVMAADNAVDQLDAIVASPWSEGHYGGSLDSFYQQLEDFELTPQEHNDLVNTATDVGILFEIWGIQANGPNYTITPGGLLDQFKKFLAGGGGGGAEPPEPKTITLDITAVPGTATGTLT